MNKLSELIVNHNSDAIEALKAINKTKSYIALVTDDNHKLIGTITDGDIRRAIDKSNYFFDMTAQDFMSKDFISVIFSRKEINKFFTLLVLFFITLNTCSTVT